MELNLNKDIYGKTSIERAIRDYGQIAHIHLEEDEHYWRLNFVESKYNMEKTISEFENYLIEMGQ